MNRGCAVLTVAVFCATGCGDSAPEVPETLVLPPLSFSQTLVLGGATAEGPSAFGSIRAAAFLLGSTQIAVADEQTQQIHVFSLAGDHVRTVGGRGGGPGEHRAVREIRGLPDGGFCTWDAQASRVTRFDSEGHVAMTSRVDLSNMEALRPSFQGFFDDCAFVLRDRRDDMGMRDEPEGLRRDTVRYVLFTAAGLEARTLAVIPDAETWFLNREGAWGRVALVFGEEYFGFAQNDEFWLGLSDSLRWTRFDRWGEGRGRTEVEVALRTVSGVDVEAERQRRLDELQAQTTQAPIRPLSALGPFAESQREGIRDVPARRTLPAYDEVLAGPGGELWIREYPRPTDRAARWILLSPRGVPEGSLSLPLGDEVLAGSEAILLVSSRDSLDAPLLQILQRKRRN